MDSNLTILLVLTTFFAFFIWKYLQGLWIWQRQNVPSISVLWIIKRTWERHLHVAMHEVYQKMCQERTPFKVIETFLVPALVIQDLDAIKDVLITQYELFSERGLYVNHKDPLLANVARLEYSLWKPLRRKFAMALTPAKTKYMFPMFEKVGDQLMQLLRESISGGNNIMEMYDLCNRFAIDFIANIGFGIDCNSLKDPAAEFRYQGNKALSEHYRPFFDPFARKYSKLMQFLNIKYHSKETMDYFTNIVKQTVEYREQNGVRRNDFMDIMIELRNDRECNAELSLTTELLVGQVFVFFAGGFGNSSSTMTYALYEMARNQEIQDKARSEIQSVMKQNGNNLSCDSLREMTYTNQIILETLRKYPSAPSLPRFCSQPSKIRTASGSIDVPANTTFIIPVYGIHHNPEFYPEPAEFRPERFDEEEVAKRPSGTYFGFGGGPKICVAERFSRAKLTFFFALVLSHYRLLVCDKTPKEILFDRRRMFNLSPRGDTFLKLEALEGAAHTSLAPKDE